MKLHQPWQVEVKKWDAPIPYDEWAAIVQGGMVANPIALRQYFEAEWEPHDCHEFMVIHKRLKRKKIPKPPRAAISRVVTLGVAEINRRYAVCLWRESLKLTTRRMTPEASQIVSDTRKRMEAQLGIDKLPFSTIPTPDDN